MLIGKLLLNKLCFLQENSPSDFWVNKGGLETVWFY